VSACTLGRRCAATWPGCQERARVLHREQLVSPINRGRGPVADLAKP